VVNLHVKFEVSIAPTVPDRDMEGFPKFAKSRDPAKCWTKIG